MDDNDCHRLNCNTPGPGFTCARSGGAPGMPSISSGAAHTPIAGWNTYCSSKAGLDMLSKCIDEEHKDFINLSIAPGKVDTPMQKDIRFADENEFPRLKEFQAYHSKKELSDPKEIAQKYKLGIWQGTFIEPYLFRKNNN